MKKINCIVRSGNDANKTFPVEIESTKNVPYIFRQERSILREILKKLDKINEEEIEELLNSKEFYELIYKINDQDTKQVYSVIFDSFNPPIFITIRVFEKRDIVRYITFNDQEEIQYIIRGGGFIE
ncbi:hypothetical protein Bp8pS_312 [Bacillus phage vB_BpuM-BpSp]|nr:hypothetical protein Bp8pS_312 [Bacillus phage vB_BpuM-BpSp]